MNIISFFSSWLKDIVVLFILITIAELFMPKGNMKRYINLIIGLLIILTIISPFVKLMKLDLNLDQTVMNYSKIGDIENKEIQEFYANQENQIEEIYKEKIKGEIRELIETRTDYKVIAVTIDTKIQEKDYGEIIGLEIILGTADMVKEEKIAVNKVEKVNLKDKEVIQEIKTDDYKEIKELIFDNFAIEKEKIKIIKGDR